MLTERFAPVLAAGTLMTARLFVSELVTNAVTHGRGQITVRAQLCNCRLRVDVLDGNGSERELDFATLRGVAGG